MDKQNIEVREKLEWQRVGDLKFIKIENGKSDLVYSHEPDRSILEKGAREKY